MKPLEHIREVLRDLEHEAVGHVNEWLEEQPQDGTGGLEADRVAHVFRTACIDAFAKGQGTWRALAMDRLMLAFAETNPEGLRETLLDAAGLLVAWVIDVQTRHTRIEAPLPAVGVRAR